MKDDFYIRRKELFESGFWQELESQILDGFAYGKHEVFKPIAKGRRSNFCESNEFVVLVQLTADEIMKSGSVSFPNLSHVVFDAFERFAGLPSVAAEIVLVDEVHDQVNVGSWTPEILFVTSLSLRAQIFKSETC